MGQSRMSELLVPKETRLMHWLSNFLLSGYCLFSSLFTFCWNFFMSNNLNGLSSSSSPPDSLMMSLERADSWVRWQLWFKAMGCQKIVAVSTTNVYLKCISCVDWRFWKPLDQDVSHVVHFKFETLKRYNFIILIFMIICGPGTSSPSSSLFSPSSLSSLSSPSALSSLSS